jgi:AraC-like DNA-binding protein
MTNGDSHPSYEHAAPSPGLQASYLAKLAAVAKVPIEQVLNGTGITPNDLLTPTFHVPEGTYVMLVERVRELSGNAALGIQLGLAMKISGHGHLGFAISASATLREALATLARYCPTRITMVAFRLHVDGPVASLVIEERADVGRVRDVLLLAIATGAWRMGCEMTGHMLNGVLDLPVPQPAYFAQYRSLCPGKVHFDQPIAQLVFDASYLDYPLLGADEESARLAREQCEQELDALGYGQFIGRVRSLVPLPEGGVRSLTQVARETNVSARTLKRRLAEQGTTYSALVEEYRRERSLLLLRSEGLSIEDVARRVGYSEAANFTRAFRRWTGVAPKVYRRSSAAQFSKATSSTAPFGSA